MNIRIIIFVTVLSFLLSTSATAVTVNEADAVNLLKKSKCLTCHSVDKKKDGPSYRDITKKYLADPTAEAKLIKHVTVPSMVKIDGEEEQHGVVKTSDMAKIKNLVAYILSRCG